MTEASNPARDAPRAGGVGRPAGTAPEPFATPSSLVWPPSDRVVVALAERDAALAVAAQRLGETQAELQALARPLLATPALARPAACRGRPITRRLTHRAANESAAGSRSPPLDAALREGELRSRLLRRLLSARHQDLLLGADRLGAALLGHHMWGRVGGGGTAGRCSASRRSWRRVGWVRQLGGELLKVLGERRGSGYLREPSPLRGSPGPERLNDSLVSEPGEDFADQRVAGAE
jgi:hypothetical protein